MPSLTFFLVACTGVVTGILGGLLGIGGGIFLIPVLVIGFGLPMHEAISASIITIIATSSSTASVYVRKGIANIKLGMTLEVMTAIGALLGGITANYIAGPALKQIFAVFILLTAGFMLYRSRKKSESHIVYDPNAPIQGSYFDDAEKRQVQYSVRRVPLAMGISLLAGNLSGLLGIGGGVIKVPAMNLACGVPMKAATATSNLMIGVTAVASAFIYFSHNNVNPYYTAAAVLGVFIGSRMGATLGLALKSKTLSLLFILLLIAASIRMLF